LREDRRQRLDEIGFLWNGHNPQWDTWDKKFAQLAAYRNEHGHCDVPCHLDEDRSFGNWVSNQRSFRIKGKLSQERIDRLDRIGFKWFARLDAVLPSESFNAHVKSLEQLWDLMFEELVRFKAENGHFRIPAGEPRLHRLFRWVIRQRENWKAGELSEERQRRLQEVGFEREPYNPSWDLKFNQLIEYKKRFGHCEVPARWPENTPLGLWVHNQRAFKRKGQLSSERIQRLDNIGFAWAAASAQTVQP
jgi:hypothetical protein